MTNISTYKLLLVGDGSTGKTTFIKKHRIGQFDLNYNATMGVEIHSLKFHTNKGDVIFNCWDCAGQEKFSGLRSGYYIKTNAALVFFDLGSKLTCKNAVKWLKDIKKVCGDIPVVLCGNKSDLKQNKVTATMIPSGQFDEYVELSTKTDSGIASPFLSILKLLQK